MKSEQKAAANNSTAMVLLGNRGKESDLAMRKAVGNLRTTSSLTGGRDSDGYYAGKVHGSNMGLRNGIGGGGTTGRLSS
jgi:hypothetical protein